MARTVEQLCDDIQRLQLMSARDYKTMRDRWFKPGRTEAADPAAFCKWLQANNYLSRFVTGVLLRGRADRLVLNGYRIRDEIAVGCLADSFLATDPLGHTVVLRTFARQVTDTPEKLARIEKVVRDVMQIQHRNVQRVLDFGTCHGVAYVVREYEEAESLADILGRRGKLGPDFAARVFAHACEGLQAVYQHHSAVDLLSAENILLVPTSSAPGAPRTVRLLVSSARKDYLDPTALGLTDTTAIPDTISLAPLDETPAAPAAIPTPQDNIFRLGCVLYQCLTGRPPYAPDSGTAPAQPAPPLAQAAPDVPEMLASLVEQMIDPDPAARPKDPGRVAKALRVFLRAEEEARAAEAADQVEMPQAAKAPRDSGAQDTGEQETAGDGEAAPDEEDTGVSRRRARETELSGVLGKLEALWYEVNPQPREWVFLAGGAIGMLVMLLFAQFLVGIQLSHLAFLVTGLCFTWFLERYLLWRRSKSGSADAAEA